jgi:tRNA dimethylallyltransferase
MKPEVILLMGPTAAGKTAVALDLARRHPIEIVSVDSAMVYRRMDIGTAKPDAALRKEIPHHLIDILDPHERYSVGQFLRDARQAMDAIRARGRTPLLTGGTMLYFHALLNGLAELPASDPQLRQDIDARAAREGWPALHAELARLDSEAAARIHPNDPQRIQRALEVCWLSGTPISRLQAERKPLLDDLHTLQVIVCPAGRAVLHQRIEARFRQMMAQGFLEEVRRLYDSGTVTAGMPSMRAVGYRQLWGHIAGAYDLAQAIDRSLAATRQLARRQLTWLRALPRARWVDPGDISVAEWIAALC